MGFLSDIGDFIGDSVGTLFGIAIAPLAIALDVSESAIKRAIKAGCRTEEEIRNYLLND